MYEIPTLAIVNEVYFRMAYDYNILILQNCKCVKIIEAESIEEAETEVINDLTLGYGCESAEVITSDILE